MLGGGSTIISFALRPIGHEERGDLFGRVQAQPRERRLRHLLGSGGEDVIVTYHSLFKLIPIPSSNSSFISRSSHFSLHVIH